MDGKALPVTGHISIFSQQNQKITLYEMGLTFSYLLQKSGFSKRCGLRLDYNYRYVGKPFRCRIMITQNFTISHLGDLA